MISGKNLPLSPAATDLGLGDQLLQQLQDSTDEQRKKRQADAKAAPVGIGMAAQSLLGQSLGYQV